MDSSSNQTPSLKRFIEEFRALLLDRTAQSTIPDGELDYEVLAVQAKIEVERLSNKRFGQIVSQIALTRLNDTTILEAVATYLMEQCFPETAIPEATADSNEAAAEYDAAMGELCAALVAAVQAHVARQPGDPSPVVEVYKTVLPVALAKLSPEALGRLLHRELSGSNVQPPLLQRVVALLHLRAVAFVRQQDWAARD